MSLAGSNSIRMFYCSYSKCGRQRSTSSVCVAYPARVYRLVRCCDRLCAGRAAFGLVVGRDGVPKALGAQCSIGRLRFDSDFRLPLWLRHRSYDRPRVLVSE